MKAKKSSKTEKKTFFDSKEKIIGACVAAAVILILVIVLMSMESGTGKLIVNNSTDLKLEYVKFKYVNLDQNKDLSTYITTKNIDANKSYTMATDPIDLFNQKATCSIYFKFEKHNEMSVDSGSFNENFEGATKITFKKTDDPNKLKMTVKARNGILPSKRTKCNDVFTVELNTGKVYD